MFQEEGVFLYLNVVLFVQNNLSSLWWWRPLQGDFNEVDCFCWILSNSKLLSASHEVGGQARPTSLQSKQFLAASQWWKRQHSCWRFPWICKCHLSCIGLSTGSLAVTWIKRCQIDVKAKVTLGQFISLGRGAMKGAVGEASPIFLFSFSCSSAEKEQFEFYGEMSKNWNSISIFAANVWFCISVAFLCKQKVVQLSTFFPQPLPLLLLFLFQFLSWKSADLEFSKELSGLNSFRPYFTNKKKGEEEVGNNLKKTFKIYDKTILSRNFLSSNYCVLESFCWETILVNKIWLHLLLSSFPSLPRLKYNVSGLLNRKAIFLLKLNSNPFHHYWMAEI